MKWIDLAGKRFARLVVMKYAGRYKWVCACDCGAVAIVHRGSLRNGHTRSCGCLKIELTSARSRVNLVGRRFGRWKVINYAGYRKWACVCACGTQRDVAGSNLQQGFSRSCGCLRREQVRARFTTHGMSKTLEYSRWKSMKARCFNPNNKAYKDYGGRGILPIEDWGGRHSFPAYFADTGTPPPGMSLDRIDVNGGYTPGNVRWADRKTQMQNRRPRRKRAAVNRRQNEPLPSSLEDPPF
jgi:hypothetical protein